MFSPLLNPLFQKPHPRLPGCIFADHLCISYANPVGEVMRETPEQPGSLPAHHCGWKFDLCHSHSAAKGQKKGRTLRGKLLYICGRLLLRLTRLPNWTLVT